MTSALLDPAAVRELAARIAPEPVDDAEDIVARAHWTAIAEPGDRIAKSLVEILGPARALHAVECSTPDAILRILRAVLRRFGLPALDPPEPPELAAGCERWGPRVDSGIGQLAQRAAECGLRLITPVDAAWSRGLDDLGPHAPIALWSRGSAPDWDRSIAVVGARAASAYGSRVAADLAVGMTGAHCPVVSGGAVGIDGVAHRVALASDGLTVAVLAGGLDRPYPHAHLSLFERVASTGMLISEVACGAAPTRWRFLQRNRLIAAMSRATVVVEAGARSGSLNTASHAAALGRPLGAVPGPVTSASSAGCHRLLRERGAVLIRDGSDVLELAELADRRDSGADPVDSIIAGECVAGADRHQDERGLGTRAWDALSGARGRSTEEIARDAGMSVREALAVLGRLELAGTVSRSAAGWLRLGPARRPPGTRACPRDLGERG